MFKVPDTDLYIALADRWVYNTELLKDVDSFKLFEVMFNEEISSDKRVEAQNTFLNIRNRINTSLAEYVWLPVIWEDNIPYIKWLDEWRIEDFSSSADI